MDVKKTNPNGANGTTSDPREQIMWDIYTANLLKGLDNAKKAAREAGYSEEHSDNITLQGWFKGRKDRLRRKEMLSKAERNLDKALDTPYETDEGKIMPDVMRIVVDVSKTIASTLGKEDYSTRTEQTGADGKDLPTPIIVVNRPDGLSSNNSISESK